MAEVLNVSVRQELGTGRVRQLRRSGQTPAILYGHGKANVNLAIPTAEVKAAMRHGSKLVDLKGGLNEKALVRAVQWDCYGVDVLHLDLTRVSEQERVEVTVALELRGEAPGVKEGGIVNHHLFEVEIECPAGEIPDKLVANLKNLHLGESITLADVPLPPHVTVLTPLDTMVVSCEAQVAMEGEEPDEAAAGPAEPEVIGRKAEEEEDSE
ncbi:MAG: 50S ribosomal protein L25 [Planctomycetaceae bacterium]|nr:50S ribosomal protein L25 [Planctomycetaceae bacterium]